MQQTQDTESSPSASGLEIFLPFIFFSSTHNEYFFFQRPFWPWRGKTIPELSAIVKAFLNQIAF